jgi:hypothetical protein
MEYIMSVQRDPARLLNIKNLNAMSTHRNDWTKRLGRPKKEPKSHRKKKTFFMHVVAKLNKLCC